MPALVNELPQLMTKRLEIRHLAFDLDEMKARNAIDALLASYKDAAGA